MRLTFFFWCQVILNCKKTKSLEKLINETNCWFTIAKSLIMEHFTWILVIAVFHLQNDALCFTVSIPNDEVGEPLSPSTMLTKVGRLGPRRVIAGESEQNEKDFDDFIRGMIFKRSGEEYNPNGSLTPFVRLGKQQLPARISSRSKEAEPIDRNGIYWNYLRQHLMKRALSNIRLKRAHTLSNIRL